MQMLQKMSETIETFTHKGYCIPIPKTIVEELKKNAAELEIEASELINEMLEGIFQDLKEKEKRDLEKRERVRAIIMQGRKESILRNYD